MPPITEADAIARYPELAALKTIVTAGWKFMPGQVESGELVSIDGYRVWPGGCRDGLRIRASTDATAIRLVAGELVWEVAGTLADVVAELLVLPAPSDPTAPRLIVGPAPVLWVP